MLTFKKSNDDLIQPSIQTMLLNDGRKSTQKRRRKGLGHFLFMNWLGLSSLVFGLVVTLAVFVFVWWLSNQVYDCPDWRIECTVRPSVAYFKRHFSILQGGLTTVYSIGLAGLLYLTCILGEATIWPILHQQEYTLCQFDTYLKATRGSLTSQPLALKAAKSNSARLAVICVFLSAALHPFASTFMGAALARRNILIPNAKSHIKTGSGIGLVFKQRYPGPAPLPGAVMTSFRHMTSWVNDSSAEPLPELRDYIIDRSALVKTGNMSAAKIGNMSASAVRITKSIGCQPHLVAPKKVGNGRLMYEVKITHPGPNIQSTVRVRFQPFLTTWVDNVRENEDNDPRSTTTVIFALMNGMIEGGAIFSSQNDTEEIHPDPFTISAIACDINVELVNSQLRIGQSNTATGNLQAVKDLKFPRRGSRASLCTWFGAATTLFGVNVYGTQPLYVHSETGTPGFWTTTESGPASNWSLKDIERFINISAGAVAMSLPGFLNGKDASNSTIESQYFSMQLDHRWSYLLLIPIILILAATAVLAALNSKMHHQLGVPAMRLATVGDILQSSATESIQEVAYRDALDPAQPSSLGGMSVRYGMCKGGVVGLGNFDVVSRFRDAGM